MLLRFNNLVQFIFFWLKFVSAGSMCLHLHEDCQTMYNMDMFTSLQIRQILCLKVTFYGMFALVLLFLLKIYVFTTYYVTTIPTFFVNYV